VHCKPSDWQIQFGRTIGARHGVTIGQLVDDSELSCVLHYDARIPPRVVVLQGDTFTCDNTDLFLQILKLSDGRFELSVRLYASRCQHLPHFVSKRKKRRTSLEFKTFDALLLYIQNIQHHCSKTLGDRLSRKYADIFSKKMRHISR
jgi:hypothetical protein